MSAADAREKLEAVIWRTRCVDQHAIIGILAAADRYRDAAVGEALARATAEHLAALGAAAAEEYRRGTA